MKALTELFQKCISIKYQHTENGGDYAYELNYGHLGIYFEHSDGAIDWKNNFSFPAKPYKDMDTLWFCHHGFLKVWKSIEPYLKDIIMSPEVHSITIVGYSHGAAIASLCHEYVWFHRPDLRDQLRGYGFGAPRVYWGWFISKKLKSRWENFTVIRNLDDIVTHLPPIIFGFRHINKVLKIGDKSKYTKIQAHYPHHYIYELENYEEQI